MKKIRNMVSIVTIFFGIILAWCNHGHGESQANLVPTISLLSDPCEISLIKPPRTKIPLVKIKINEHEGMFILDTGASHTVVSNIFADRIGLTKKRRIKVKRAKRLKGQFFEFARVDALIMGVAEFRDFDILILDIVHLSEAVSTRIDGIIGGNILSSTIYTLDCHEQKLTMHGSSGPAQIPYLSAIFKNNKVYLPVVINGVAAIFQLDTGANLTKIAETELERFNISPEKVKRRKTKNFDIAGSRVIYRRMVELDSFAIGEQVLEKKFYVRIGKENLLGMDVIASYSVTVDPFLNRVAFH